MAKTKKQPTTNGEANPKEFTLNEFMEREMALLTNEVLGRSNWLQYMEGVAARDINKECGYPETEQLTIENHFKPFYERLPIATRVVGVLPDECWRVCPEVYETEDNDKETPFEMAWNELSLSLMGKSKFKSKQGSPVWEYLHRVDELSGIGWYGVLFLGFSDGKEDLSQPVEAREGLQLLYMRAFDQSLAKISTFNDDIKNPRHGMPELYTIEFSAPLSLDGIGATSVTKSVHWSRVIHIADNLGANEVFGVPRQRPVFNNLWDLRKLYGGSAEMYWKGAFPGISVETHPQLGAAADFGDKTAMREMMQNYMQGLQRYLALKGASANSLAPQVVDPSPQIETQIDAICVQIPIPKRIFIGSERGELASTQDKGAWNERLESRHNNYLTPRVVATFVDRLITLKVLPEPAEYSIEWPNLNDLTAQENAEVGIKKTEAMVKYVAGDVEAIMGPLDFFVHILKMEKEEAEAILEAALEDFEESQIQEVKGGNEEDGMPDEFGNTPTPGNPFPPKPTTIPGKAPANTNPFVKGGKSGNQ